MYSRVSHFITDIDLMIVHKDHINETQEILLCGRNPKLVSHTGNRHGAGEDRGGTLNAPQLPG